MCLAVDEFEKEEAEAAAGRQREDEEAACDANEDDVHHCDLDSMSLPPDPEPEDLSWSAAPESSLESTPTAAFDDPQERLSPATAIGVFEWATPPPMLDPSSGSIKKPRNRGSALKRREDSCDTAGPVRRALNLHDFPCQDRMEAMKDRRATKAELKAEHDKMLSALPPEGSTWRRDRRWRDSIYN